MAKKRKADYLNTKLSFEERAHDLLSRMTPEEKLSQMLHSSPEIKRLGIPKYNWWNEALHGVARAGIATVFPQAIGLAATFNDELIFKAADAISGEARAKYHKALRADFREMYYGINFWSPNINIFRDPRWGRGQETYGEDPFLTAYIGTAFVKGMQGNDPKYLKTAACAKHFAVHSGPEALRHTFDAKVSEKDMNETYLPAFKALVKDAGVEAVMGAYNRTLGEPCCASKRLLVDILRNEWGFKGHVVSDCGAVHDIYKNHIYTKTAAEAAALSTKTGCDLNCCLGTEKCSESGKGLEKAYRYGLITEKDIDPSVKRLLMTRFRLGVFDPDKDVKYSKIPYSVVDSPAHRSLALETARQSLVLLKNENILPLKGIRSIAVIGPNADDIEALTGNYSGFPSSWTTPLQGIKKAAGKNVRVNYLKICNVNDAYTDYLNAIDEMAVQNDIFIAFLGLNSTAEGEEGAGDGDRESLDLPGAQLQLLERACKTGRPVIVVLMNGSSVAFDNTNKNIRAIIEAWYPGEEGGRAIADALFGRYNPAGRLPVTFYRSVDDLPDFRDYSMKNRTYRYFKGIPMYPFGYGLSYTKFRYSKLRVPEVIKNGESLNVSVEVMNAGKMDGEEVVQLYLKYPRSVKDAPLKTLCGIRRINLKKGKRSVVAFTLTPQQLAAYNSDGKQVIEPGEYEIYLGGVQPGFEKIAASTGVVKAKFILCDICKK
jgi:beta-glucosidase